MKKALPNLEVLRFVAAVAIVIWHYQHFAYVGPARVDFATREQPFFGPLHLAYTAGALAVPLFWLLSGYIFFHQYSQRIASRRISAQQFAILRFSRLYPLHIVTMIAVLILQWSYRRITPLNVPFVYQHNDAHDVLLHLAMASQWAEHRRYSINGPVWSVSMEVLGYAAFFIAMRFVPKPMWAIAPAPFLLIWSINTYSMLGIMFALFFLGEIGRAHV